MDRLWAGLPGEGPCSTGKGGSAQVRGWKLGANKLHSKYQCSACSHGWALCMLGDRGGKWHLLVPLSLEGSSHDPYVSGLYSDMRKSRSFLSTPSIFQTVVSRAVFARAVCHMSL